MTISISLINSINSMNLLNQMLNRQSSTATSLNNLLSSASSTSALLSSASKTNQLSVNLSAVSLITASGALTTGNPNSVFTGGTTQNATQIKNAVTTFVSAFNKAVDSLSGSSNAISNQSAKSLASLASANASAFADIGITVDDNGKLSVDTAKLNAAVTGNQKKIQAVFNDTTFVSTVTSKVKTSISQSLGISSGAGFLAMYSNSLSSGMSGLLSSNNINGYI